ncbi:hypothetical protein GE061_016977 [Apolygus lucorum]|uniref:Uncharacterized protein n=1 Tax=Apolygus lucorum TaxID=248454 RepID=A0A6A4J0D6_APOLU|nr:hypothetical protein GE061_016977 [Apolygus lucorum]
MDKLPVVPDCCCFCCFLDLRAGSLIIGWVSLLIGITRLSTNTILLLSVVGVSISPDTLGRLTFYANESRFIKTLLGIEYTLAITVEMLLILCAITLIVTICGIRPPPWIQDDREEEKNALWARRATVGFGLYFILGIILHLFGTIVSFFENEHWLANILLELTSNVFFTGIFFYMLVVLNSYCQLIEARKQNEQTLRMMMSELKNNLPPSYRTTTTSTSQEETFSENQQKLSTHKQETASMTEETTSQRD